MTEGRRPLTFDALDIGEEFPPLTVTYSEADAKRLAFAADDYNPQYFAPEHPHHLSPMVVANAMLAVHYQTYERPAQQTFHMKQTYEFRRPPLVGETITIRGRVTDKYSRRGIDRFVIEAEAIGESGDQVLAGTHTFGWPRGERLRTSTPQGHAAQEQPARDPAPVAVLPEATLMLTQDRITAFTGATRQDSIHTNPDVARRAGLASTIAQGAQSATFLFGRLVAWFGDEFLTSGRMDLAFIGAVAVDDTIVVRGFTDGGGDAARNVDSLLLVECVTQTGRTVLAGSAGMAGAEA